MAPRSLPQPVSVTDEYLAAVHDLLGEIRDRLPAPKQDSKPGRTQVSEPGTVARRRTGSAEAASPRKE